MLTSIGVETSLRYAIHLITASHLCARRRTKNQAHVKVASEDVTRAYKLFFDEARSVQYLKEYNDLYMFHEKEDTMTPLAIHRADANGQPMEVDVK